MADVFDKVAQNVKDISQGIIGQTKTTVTQGKIEIDLLQARKIQPCRNAFPEST